MSGIPDTPTFDSLDWIEDAAEILDRSDFQYVLLSAITPSHTRMDLHMDPTEEN